MKQLKLLMGCLMGLLILVMCTSPPVSAKHAERTKQATTIGVDVSAGTDFSAHIDFNCIAELPLEIKAPPVYTKECDRVAVPSKTLRPVDEQNKGPTYLQIKIPV